VAGNKKFTVSAEIRAEDRASPTIQRVEGRFSSLRGVMDRFVITAGDIVNAARQIGGALVDMFQSAAEAERGQTRLALALERQGAATPKVIAALNEQATAIARVTDLQDDQVTSVQALLAQIGVAAGQIPEATLATINFAKAFGIDLNTAAKQVAGTLTGTAGRLTKLVPELAGLSAEALKAGAAFGVIEKALGGTLQATTADFASQVKGLQNDVGELGESFARAVTGTTSFEAAVVKLRTEVQALEPVVVGLGRLVGAFAAAAGRIGELFGAVQGFSERVSQVALDFLNAGERVEFAGGQFEAVSFKVNTAGLAFVGLGEATEKAIPAVVSIAEATTAAGDAIGKTGEKIRVETVAVEELDTALREVGVATETATGSFDAQAASLDRMTTAAVAAGVAIGKLAERQSTLEGLRGDAVGFSQEAVEVLAANFLGGSLQSGLGLGGHSTGLGVGGTRSRRGVTVDPNGRRVRAA
jgi:hypothetical protein